MLNQWPVRGFVRVVLVSYNGTDTFLEKRKIKEHSDAVPLKGCVHILKVLQIFPAWALSLPVSDAPKPQDFMKSERGTFRSRF